MTSLDTFAVALLGWSAGFVVNRLSALLREHGFSLDNTFRIAWQIAEGRQVAIPFATMEQADRFAREARSVGGAIENSLAGCGGG